VIYRPESERQSHYFAAHLSPQFDAMVWFEETSAVHPLAAEGQGRHPHPGRRTLDDPRSGGSQGHRA
jgi:hypothetical protein